MAKPVQHDVADRKAWKTKWTTDRKPKAMASGVGSARADDSLAVSHEVLEEATWKAHVEEFDKAGKRKEMGAKNKPF